MSWSTSGQCQSLGLQTGWARAQGSAKMPIILQTEAQTKETQTDREVAGFYVASPETNVLSPVQGGMDGAGRIRVISG